MIEINGSEILSGGPMSRRHFVRVGAYGIAGITLAQWLALKAQGKIDDSKAKAKAVILLWMGGGPTHIDTFDPKPEAGEDVCGPLRKPIETNVPGIRIGELLPELAKQADKYTIIRSMTHPSNGHETATHIMMAGSLPSADLSYPSMGTVVAYLKGYEAGYQGSIPPFVMLTNPLGRFSEEGFLGSKYRSFSTGGYPNPGNFHISGLVPAKGVTQERISRRRSLLASVDTLARDLENESKIHKAGEFEQKVHGLILGDAKKAFDLLQESKETREKYGCNEFGQSCLLARRLVEAGVPFVTVNHGGWDTHTDHFPRMKETLPNLDKGFAALLADLAQRGLLDSTIVLWEGEFGRTPKVATEAPWNGGRHHFAQCFSSVVAGGGFKGGHIIGASDLRGENVNSRPVYPWDLSASVYQLLGIDLQGSVAYISPQQSAGRPNGGILTEIM